MDETAKISLIPKLEINNDDVVCTHGAASGKPDESVIFYLKSRGIPQDKAEKIYVEGFLGEFLDKISNKIIKQLDRYYLGDGIDSLPLSVVNTLLQKNRTLAVAESCTGGYLTSLLTDVPGSSNVFNVGYITYSNQFKNELLNVSSDILNHRGAVSSEVAIAMSEGCLNQSNASYALSITGIAGPGGGSEGKPVGTVYISLASKLHDCLLYTSPSPRDS